MSSSTSHAVAKQVTLVGKLNIVTSDGQGFHECKTHNFQMKDYEIYLLFAPNIDCEYTLDLH